MECTSYVIDIEANKIIYNNPKIFDKFTANQSNVKLIGGSPI